MQQDSLIPSLEDSRDILMRLPLDLPEDSMGLHHKFYRIASGSKAYRGILIYQ